MTETSSTFAFYGGVEAVTYYLDDIRLEPASSAASAPRRGVPPAFNTLFSLDGELVNDVIGYVYRDWVYTMVEHFDAYGWDVVNETFSDWPAGAFRTPQNTSGEVFVWGQYFKSTKDWVDKAFAYATDALARNGKTAVLYLNDYNLETSSEKRKAYCDYVKGNPQVTGVGTQMHLDMATPDLKNKVVASLTDLKNTGRMVRISELDIKCTSLTDQADLYKFIFQKYVQVHLPEVPGNRPGGPARRHHHLGHQRQGLLGETGAGRQAEHAAPVPGRQLRPQARLGNPLPVPLRGCGVGSVQRIGPFRALFLFRYLLAGDSFPKRKRGV